METSTMTPTPGTAKNRTVALPHFTKTALTGAKGAAKGHDVAAIVEAMWNGTAFGPYLIPLSRRAE
jgi:hypothetical protein